MTSPRRPANLTGYCRASASPRIQDGNDGPCLTRTPRSRSWAPEYQDSRRRTTSSIATAAIFEATDHYAGHIHSEVRDGFTWDDGPHISFTANEYVRNLFAELIDGEHEECPIKPSNYYRGHWIEHPAQTHLYQVPEPLRTECLASFLSSRDDDREPRNYQDWLDQSMGPVFAKAFPAAYTRKYWTTDPSNLDTDWIGVRVLKPDVDDVVNGAKGALGRSTYYVAGRDARYPSRGGFMAYTHRMAEGADIRYRADLERIDFGQRRLGFSDGSEIGYEHVISTIPLPVLIAASVDAPASVRDAAALLRCTNFLRVDVAVRHPTRREELWMYVYDEDKLSVRISTTRISRLTTHRRARRGSRSRSMDRSTGRCRPTTTRSSGAWSTSSSRWGSSTAATPSNRSG